jgi:hypothetical protein
MKKGAKMWSGFIHLRTGPVMDFLEHIDKLVLCDAMLLDEWFPMSIQTMVPSKCQYPLAQ